MIVRQNHYKKILIVIFVFVVLTIGLRYAFSPAYNIQSFQKENKKIITGVKIDGSSPNLDKLADGKIIGAKRKTAEEVDPAIPAYEILDLDDLKNIPENIKYLPFKGYLAPPFDLEDSEGGKISLESLKGKNILLIFETTTCGFCRKELPLNKKLAEEYEGKLFIYTIDMGESKETVQAWKKEKNISRPWLLDKDSNVSNLYWVTGTPSHFFIDEEGEIMNTWPGFADYEQLVNLTENLLKN